MKMEFRIVSGLQLAVQLTSLILMSFWPRDEITSYWAECTAPSILATVIPFPVSLFWMCHVSHGLSFVEG